jgi:thioredoxin 1
MDQNPKPYRDLTQPHEVDALMKDDGGPIVIDFWAPWCAPCRAMAPAFEAVARKYEDQEVRFFKVNTQDHPALGKAFQITSLPTVLFINNGQFMDHQIGAAPAPLLDKKTSTLLSKARGEGVLTRWFGIGRKKQPDQA